MVTDVVREEQLAKSFRRFYKEATDADAASFVASVRAKATRVTMSQLQEHFVQHRTSTMAEATTDIRLGGWGERDGCVRQRLRRGSLLLLGITLVKR